MIELMVVIAIILVLIGMAAARYEQSVVRAREAVLKQDLQTMRSAIQQYTLDKQKRRNRWTIWFPPATCVRFPTIPSPARANGTRTSKIFS